MLRRQAIAFNPNFVVQIKRQRSQSCSCFRANVLCWSDYDIRRVRLMKGRVLRILIVPDIEIRVGRLW